MQTNHFENVHPSAATNAAELYAYITALCKKVNIKPESSWTPGASREEDPVATMLGELRREVREIGRQGSDSWDRWDYCWEKALSCSRTLRNHARQVA